MSSRFDSHLIEKKQKSFTNCKQYANISIVFTRYYYMYKHVNAQGKRKKNQPFLKLVTRKPFLTQV